MKQPSKDNGEFIYLFIFKKRAYEAAHGELMLAFCPDHGCTDAVQVSQHLHLNKSYFS